MCRTVELMQFLWQTCGGPVEVHYLRPVVKSIPWDFNWERRPRREHVVLSNEGNQARQDGLRKSWCPYRA